MSDNNISEIEITYVKYKGKKFNFLKPIKILITRKPNYFYAQVQELSVCGAGKNEKEAIQILSNQIAFYYIHYNKMPFERMTEDGKSIRNLFVGLFEEVS